ncbi:MAG: ankyrin repeat domain-containing protein [Pseudomonadota bacterium]
MIKKISSFFLLLIGIISLNQTVNAEAPQQVNIPKTQPVAAPTAITIPPLSTQASAQQAQAEVQAMKDYVKNEEKSEKLYKTNLNKQKTEDALFVSELLKLNYQIQNPPKKLYDRPPSNSNAHLPPVYFKSYYLSLAFKAAEENNINALNAVFVKYKYLNAQNIDGDTILMKAVQSNSLNVARSLLAKGAYVNAANHRDRTALHYAAILGNSALLKLLLSTGADFTLTDDRGLTPMDYAIASKQNISIDLINKYMKQNDIH